MQNDAATLQCSNDFCKAPNCQTDKFCQQCGTPLIKRYLWAVGELRSQSAEELLSGARTSAVPFEDEGAGIEAYKLGDLVDARYLLIGDLVDADYPLKSNRIFLDTKPGLSPERPIEISNAIKPYLRLVTYQLQIPQVYGLVTLGKGHATEVLLLEQAPIYTDAVPLAGQLMPELTGAWKEATSMRQLNWLWQWATLWQPLSSEGVASSLLAPQLLRVEGSLLRLLQLRQDDSSAPYSLPQLGQLWKSQLLPGAQRVIADFLEKICQALIQGEVRYSQELVAILDQGLASVGRSQARTLNISTNTDTGPSRQRNEDACYPPSGTSITSPPAQEALAIVCDGIGGHEGGNVASNLAIETIQQQVQKIPLDDSDLNPTSLISNLEDSACAANDRISQRNDNEHRHDRQRMGTTLVMALAHAHEVYITHIGDSRAYWITRTGCHQVTLDDDVASREVRLGYAVYGDALQHASSGSLVQALGMSSSAALHPTVQRFVLDEDCVFLLCSDGLSDYDRVEQCWETEILPILDGKVDVAAAGARLVEIANTQNGHDNVTVGLVHCQVSSFEPESTLSDSLAILANGSSALAAPAEVTVLQDANTPKSARNDDSMLDTHLLSSQHTGRRNFTPVLLGLILLLGGLLVYLSKQGSPFSLLITTDPSPSVAPSPTSSLSPAVEPPEPKQTVAVRLESGALIQIPNKINLGERENRPSAIAPNIQSSLVRHKGSVPAGSVLKVVDRPEPDDFLKLRICSIPSTGTLEAAKQKPPQQTPPSSRNVESLPTASDSKQLGTNSGQLKQGEEGWIQEKTLILSDPTNVLPSPSDQCPASNTLKTGDRSQESGDRSQESGVN